jgi:Ca2+-binding EF-hand superfamily protein
MRSLGINVSSHEARQVLESADENHTGGLDFEEFLALILRGSVVEGGAQITAAQLRRVKQIFSTFDRDRSGRGSRARRPGR